MVSEEMHYCPIPGTPLACVHHGNPNALLDQTLICSSSKCSVVLKVHGDCLNRLERKLPRSCVPIFNNQTTKNTPSKVLDKSFGTNFYKRINKDILLSLCGCKCGQGFLVKGNRSKKKKREKVQPNSKTSTSRTFGVKMKRKPRLKSIEKRCSSLANAEPTVATQAVESIPGLSKKAQNRRSSIYLESFRCHQTVTKQISNSRGETQGDQWVVVSKKRPPEVKKKENMVEKQDKDLEKKDDYDEDNSDEEPLFITQLLEWWSMKKPCLVQGDSTQDKRMAHDEGSGTHLPPQNCSLSGKLKKAKGFGLSREIRPWLRSQFSSHGYNDGCWRCRRSENGQENFVKYFQEREREVRGQHAASTGEIVSSENTREMVYGENISWREQVSSNSCGDNNVAELKKVVARDEDPQQKVTNTATAEQVEKSDQNKCYRKKKSDLFRQLKYWRPNLPVIIENGTEDEALHSEEDDLLKSVSLEEKVVRLRKDILNAKAEHLSLKILHLIIDRLAKSTEKHSTSSIAETWKPSHPVTLKEPEKCLPNSPLRAGDASQAGSKDEKCSVQDIPAFKTETSKRGIVQTNIIHDQPSLRPCDPVFSWMMGCRLA